ncbi:unnamed protein product [Rhodiola kirilowii]
MSNAAAAPTGCFKCGRPGHWSRDCPSSGPELNPNPNPTSDSAYQSSKSAASGKELEKPTEKLKKAPRTRPKLTPESLLSNDGLGYVLRHFPRSFKYRGRGHEVSDLGNLIGMYEEWHSHLLPYYSFEQFVHKVEQVGTTKHVKMALRDLREKIANGGDLTKLHEMSGDHQGNHEQEAKDLEDPGHDHEDASFQNQDDIMQEDILHNIFEKTNEVETLYSLFAFLLPFSIIAHEPVMLCPAEVLINSSTIEPTEASHALQSKTTGDTTQCEVDVSSKGIETEKAKIPTQGNNSGKSGGVNEMTEEQKARIEANRMKALEKAAARKAAALSGSS